MSPVTNDPDDTAPSEIYNFDGYSIFERKDGIVQIKFNAGFIITAEDAAHYTSVIKKIKGGEKCLLLVIFEPDNSFTRETRDQMSCAATAEILKASAVVMQGMALKILIGGYININKPKHHVKMFESREKAVSWLLQLD